MLQEEDLKDSENENDEANAAKYANGSGAYNNFDFSINNRNDGEYNYVASDVEEDDDDQDIIEMEGEDDAEENEEESHEDNIDFAAACMEIYTEDNK